MLLKPIKNEYLCYVQCPTDASVNEEFKSAVKFSPGTHKGHATKYGLRNTPNFCKECSENIICKDLEHKTFQFTTQIITK